MRICVCTDMCTSMPNLRGEFDARDRSDDLQPVPHRLNSELLQVLDTRLYTELCTGPCRMHRSEPTCTILYTYVYEADLPALLEASAPMFQMSLI